MLGILEGIYESGGIAYERVEAVTGGGYLYIDEHIK